MSDWLGMFSGAGPIPVVMLFVVAMIVFGFLWAGNQ